MTINFNRLIIYLGLILTGGLIVLFLVLYFYGDLLKYQNLDMVLKTTSQNQYNSSYNCVNFSQDAVEKLQQEGISSNVIVIENPSGDGTHAVISVWFDPQTNSFVPQTEYLGDYQVLKTLYGWVNR